MLTLEQKVQRILEAADTEILASYASSYLIAAAATSPAMLEEEYEKYFPPDDELPSDEQEAVIDLAKDKYGSDEVEIDADADTSEGADGIWVQAWVFLSNAELRAEGIDNPEADDESEEGNGLCVGCGSDGDDVTEGSQTCAKCAKLEDAL